MELLAQTHKDEITFCTFWLAGRLFGINILDIKEINSNFDFTPIFHTPPELKGYVNIRGSIFLIGDMRLLLGFDQNSLDTKNKMIIFKNSLIDSFGVVVDQIDDIMTVHKSQIIDRRKGEDKKNNPHVNKRKDKYNIGLGICKKKDQVMIAMNTDAVINKIHNLLNDYR